MQDISLYSLIIFSKSLIIAFGFIGILLKSRVLWLRIKFLEALKAHVRSAKQL